jgi:SPP1 gp7 family putative phage head morphogenesis protein
MPLMKCTKNGQSGWKWGESGFCYIGKNAKQKAIQQALAIGGGEFPEEDLKRTDNPDNFKTFIKQFLLANPKKAKKRKTKWLYPTAVEIKYTKYIKGIMKNFVSVTVHKIKPMLRSWKNSAKKELQDYRIDGPADELEIYTKRFQEIQNEIFVVNEGKLKAELADIFMSVSAYNQEQFIKGLKAFFGTSYKSLEPWLDPLMKFWVLENISLIKGLSDEYLKEIQRIVLDGFQKGATAENLAKKLTKSNKKYGRTRARLIARDQIGKLNGKLTEKRQKSIGVDLYIWSTSGDKRVRDSHSVLNNKYCRWDDPTVYSDDGKIWNSRSSIGGTLVHPGQDIQCRCAGLPVYDEILEEAR